MRRLLDMFVLQGDGIEHLNRILPSIVLEGGDKTRFGIDMSIEGVSSQQYSNFIFGFLVASLIVFSFIIYLYMPRGQGRLKKAEKIMVGAIIVGVVIAFIFGWLQLIQGYLV